MFELWPRLVLKYNWVTDFEVVTKRERIKQLETDLSKDPINQ